MVRDERHGTRAAIKLLAVCLVFSLSINMELRHPTADSTLESHRRCADLFAFETILIRFNIRFSIRLNTRLNIRFNVPTVPEFVLKQCYSGTAQR